MKKIGLIFLSFLLAQPVWAQSSSEYIVSSNIHDWPEWYVERPLPDGRHISIIEPTYEIIERKILERPVELLDRSIPSVTREVERKYVAVPARTELETIPADTRQISRRVIEKEASFEKKEVAEVAEFVWSQNPISGQYEKEEIVISPSYFVYSVTLPKFKSIKETVLVQPETQEIIQIPATYETRLETIELFGSTEYVFSPAKFVKTTGRIQTSPARLVLMDYQNEILHDFVNEKELDHFLADPAALDFLYKTHQFITAIRDVEVVPESIIPVIIPATFEIVTEQVVVQEAYIERVMTPAKFETISETVIIQEAYNELIAIPAKFETSSKTVISDPSVNGGPPKTKIVQQRIKTEAAHVEERMIPAVIENVQKRVISQPVGIIERHIPAITKLVSQRSIKEPAQEIEKVTPAVTKQISIKRIIEPIAPNK